jgi:hypothetical protein
MLQYAQKLCYENNLESRAANKRAFDVKKKFRQFKVNDKDLLYIPSPLDDFFNKSTTVLQASQDKANNIMMRKMPSLGKLSASKQNSSLDGLFNKSATLQANQKILLHSQEFGMLEGCYMVLLLSCTIPFRSSLHLAHSWSCRLGTSCCAIGSRAIFTKA